MSFAQSALIETYARLRMACRALSSVHGGAIGPADIRLDDLSENERTALLREAEQDVWDLLTPPTVHFPRKGA